MKRHGSPVRDRTHIFQHPGVDKAKVGAPEASRWHLKPVDHAPKHVRIAESDIPVTFRRAAKEKAQGR